MIWLTKRIRVAKALRLFDEFGGQPVVDVGSGVDDYFVNKLRERQVDAVGLELERGEDFLKAQPRNVAIITGLALLWHIDVGAFFKTCKAWGAQKVILIQGNGSFEPITRMYSIGHKHNVLPIEKVIDLAEEQGFVVVHFKKGLLWWEIVFRKVTSIRVGSFD